MVEQTVRIEGRRLRLSNLDKVLYPATGTTKGEVIDYYTRIAPLLLPHTRGRPATRKRWPDGVGTDTDPGEPFFAKALEPGAPAWVARHPIDHSSGAKDYPLVDDLPTLVYLAQVASLELHVPQWRFTAAGERQNPDRLVLDLDPGPGVAPGGHLPRMIMPRTSSLVTSSVLAPPTIWPFFITTTRSARSKTSWMSWLIRKMPIPSFFSSLISSPTCAVSCGPSAAVGSSMIRILALKRIARAMATDWR